MSHLDLMLYPARENRLFIIICFKRSFTVSFHIFNYSSYLQGNQIVYLNSAKQMKANAVAHFVHTRLSKYLKEIKKRYENDVILD